MVLCSTNVSIHTKHYVSLGYVAELDAYPRLQIVCTMKQIVSVQVCLALYYGLEESVYRCFIGIFYSFVQFGFLCIR